MPQKAQTFPLAHVRSDMLDYCERLRDRDGCHGAYRMAPRARCDLYSSCDIAILRTIIGENLAATLGDSERAEWCGHINSFIKHGFERPDNDGYCDTMGHSQLHANGMVIGALGVLGGKQVQRSSILSHPCRGAALPIIQRITSLHIRHGGVSTKDCFQVWQNISRTVW